MFCFTSVAVPEVLATLADIRRRLAGRAIPAMRIRRGTDIIRRMVFYLRRAVPIVGAVFARCETNGIRCTITVTAVGALRQRRRVFVRTSGTVPIMRATGIGTPNSQAGFTEPISVAGCIGRMPTVAGITPPGVQAMLRRRKDFGAVFAPTVFSGTGIRLQMTVSMSRAVP